MAAAGAVRLCGKRVLRPGSELSLRLERSEDRFSWQMINRLVLREPRLAKIDPMPQPWQ